MVEPVNFGFNPETAINNAFQVSGNDDFSQLKAANEFSNFVRKLRVYDIDVLVLEDTPSPYTPDSIFPNNWISFHQSHKNLNTLCLYPMFAKNRRAERKPHFLKAIEEKFVINKTFDFTYYEKDNKFLEGTGSMVLDRDNAVAYACLSERTDKDVLSVFCDKLNYRSITFNAFDCSRNPVYHTNVMMSIAEQYAIICLDSIPDQTEKTTVISSLIKANKDVIEISMEQMNSFAGNMLQVRNITGEQFLVMSSTALRSLQPSQVKRILQYNNIIDTELATIEKNGGGSARCMLAEIFLDKKESEMID
jgi:hypothetical protein